MSLRRLGDGALDVSPKLEELAINKTVGVPFSCRSRERWTGHPIDPTLSWPQVDCLDGSLHGACAGSVQGFLERLTLNPNRRLLGADIAFKPGPRPPGHPRIFWVPIVAIQTIPSYVRWVPSPYLLHLLQTIGWTRVFWPLISESCDVGHSGAATSAL